MGVSYEFSIGSVRSKEKSLLSAADLSQLLALSSEDELVRFLSDKGYGDGDTADEIIADNEQKMWEYLKSIVPDPELLAPFFRQNDIHNFKAAIKGIMSGREYEALLMFPASISAKELTDALENRRFDRLPEWVAGAADQAYELLAQTKDARLSDAVIDRAMLRSFTEYAASARSDFLREYFLTQVFYSDIKIAIRASRTGTSMDYLDKALQETEGIDMPVFKRKTLAGSGELLKYLENLSAFGCSAAIAKYRESPALFEKAVDDMMILMTRKYCRYSSEGAEPLLGYYLASVHERKLVHIIASGLKTNTPPEKIRERLRETYG